MYFNFYHFYQSIALKILVTESKVEGKSTVTIVYLFSVVAIVLSKIKLLVKKEQLILMSNPCNRQNQSINTNRTDFVTALYVIRNIKPIQQPFLTLFSQVPFTSGKDCFFDDRLNASCF